MSQYGTTVGFDIVRFIQCLLFDMISQLCLGRSLSFIDRYTDWYNFPWMLDILGVRECLTHSSCLDLPLILRVLPFPSIPFKAPSWLLNAVGPPNLPSKIITAIFAGSDTTATSIRASLLHIISDPLIYAKLTVEIRPVREAECLKLRYLQACVKEGQREFPPFGGDTVRGYYMPEGTRICVNMPGLLRNEIFGDDPKVFWPER
ncbi:cytochrome P450 [Lophiostoma macrostomum CBS 122681]|uniref:Cytochrome P450 n=1 Tax=Lophiostoma macrostomum CBS 122681 TaxID=1314788 RepID=A0A6A6SPM8_9PLEO|nr:cytochrome P450 [Lophiostoma macrostomum CBS 122681]